jgi:hypothetical protein
MRSGDLSADRGADAGHALPATRGHMAPLITCDREDTQKPRAPASGRRAGALGGHPFENRMGLR